jgi:hypothetical protein
MERYGVPDPMDSLESLHRFAGKDLDTMPVRALRVEHWRCQQALVAIPPTARSDIAEQAWDWWWERLEHIRVKLREARGR